MKPAARGKNYAGGRVQLCYGVYCVCSFGYRISCGYEEIYEHFQAFVDIFYYAF
jgi:hypothetical protein